MTRLVSTLGLAILVLLGTALPASAEIVTVAHPVQRPSNCVLMDYAAVPFDAAIVEGPPGVFTTTVYTHEDPAHAMYVWNLRWMDSPTPPNANYRYLGVSLVFQTGTRFYLHEYIWGCG